jgi:hypothetical protein
MRYLALLVWTYWTALGARLLDGHVVLRQLREGVVVWLGRGQNWGSALGGPADTNAPRRHPARDVRLPVQSLQIIEINPLCPDTVRLDTRTSPLSYPQRLRASRRLYTRLAHHPGSLPRVRRPNNSSTPLRLRCQSRDPAAYPSALLNTPKSGQSTLAVHHTHHEARPINIVSRPPVPLPAHH